MQHGKRIGLANQLSVQVEKVIEPRISFGVIDGSRHQQVSGVMVAFRFDQAGVECGKFLIDWFEFGREDLEFFAASSFNERTANEMVDRLVSLTIADRAH